MMSQLGASLMIVILTALEVSFTLLESSIMLLDSICSTGAMIIIYHDHIFIVQAPDVCFVRSISLSR